MWQRLVITTAAILAGGCGETHPVPATTPARTARARLGQLPETLARDGRWERFAALWRELDAAETGSSAEQIPYASVAAWRDRLTAILGPSAVPTEAWFAGGDMDPLTEVLVRFTRYRIECLGPSMSMMTRMMPPPGLVFHERLLDEFEARMDALVGLREAGHVDDDAFARGLAAVANDVYLGSVIELVGESFMPQSAERNPEAWVRGYDAQYEQADASTQELMRAQHEQVSERLRKLEALRPQLEQLVRELEREQ